MYGHDYIFLPSIGPGRPRVGISVHPVRKPSLTASVDLLYPLHTSLRASSIVSTTTARVNNFRFASRRELVTVEEYFKTQYGISLFFPTGRLVALDGPESGDFNEGDLYPGELLLLC
ncbi:hypothetical protein CAEBREN_12107 [Caenorhabditis brenneri]|uniref:PAZ domain-containing protein n=1 Tax=Caenorhabditis brenneri TaxID=135651 RepID=G0PGM1_CAEBE|nr:hypothetical protein CAEBREN_12107 [Caenorhabditis brenneri]